MNTTETKHTPGPWNAMINIGLSDAWIRAAPDTEGCGDICHLSGWQTEAQQRKNAQVIAAAPDMLEALKALFDNCAMIHKTWGNGDNSKVANNAIKQAQAAIAKAEGK